MKKSLNKPPKARSRLKVKQQKQNNLANSNFPYILHYWHLLVLLTKKKYSLCEVWYEILAWTTKTKQTKLASLGKFQWPCQLGIYGIIPACSSRKNNVNLLKEMHIKNTTRYQIHQDLRYPSCFKTALNWGKQKETQLLTPRLNYKVLKKHLKLTGNTSHRTLIFKKQVSLLASHWMQKQTMSLGTASQQCSNQRQFTFSVFWQIWKEIIVWNKIS